MSDTKVRDALVNIIASLREDERQWRTDRQRVIMRCRDLIDAGVISPRNAAMALQISLSTLYRRLAELSALLEDDAAEMAALASAVAADDQEAARIEAEKRELM
jgi:hypothetical protein